MLQFGYKEIRGEKSIWGITLAYGEVNEKLVVGVAVKSPWDEEDAVIGRSIAAERFYQQIAENSEISKGRFIEAFAEVLQDLKAGKHDGRHQKNRISADIQNVLPPTPRVVVDFAAIIEDPAKARDILKDFKSQGYEIIVYARNPFYAMSYMSGKSDITFDSVCSYIPKAKHYIMGKRMLRKIGGWQSYAEKTCNYNMNHNGFGG